MRRALVSATVVALLLAASGSPARATAASWQLEQPPPPPPPAGINGVDRPLGLGQVGDIKFWAPNRGLLTTGGNPPAIPKGLWAYDGVGWHLLSTVCGSGIGRIAWAGPDEFWTVSDPAPTSQQARLIGVTLCHFVNGVVVASYATPTGATDPYTEMSAAACNGPSDCWFGGSSASAPLTGAFHLHWDGSNLTDALAPQDRQIYSLAALQGQFFESTFVTAGGDQPVPPENPPVLLHRIVAGLPPSDEFVNEPFTPASQPNFPSYLTLATDGTELWAVGGQSSDFQRPPLAARFVGGNFEELGVDTTQFKAPDAFLGVAPEPGGGDAWITVGQPFNDSQPLPAARVARIADDGTTREMDAVPAPGSGQTNHGSAAGPIACPAPSDCWLVTKEGWLYHYTDGSVHQPDTDPAFSAVIDARPPDAGTITIAPDSSPLDDSLANQPPPVQVTPPPPPKTKAAKPPKPIHTVTNMHERLHGTTLELSFTLNVRAKVSLSGLRGGRTVARAASAVLARGRHVLRLRLNIHRWPMKLKFTVTPTPTPKKR